MVIRVLTRSLINGGSFNRQVSMAIIPARSVVDEFFHSRRRMMPMMMMTTTPSSSSSQEKTTSSTEKEDRKEKTVEDNVMVSSYWGISKPKITRDDGTEWPWNCFMVTIFLFLFFF